jgi:hypothetical protein
MSLARHNADLYCWIDNVVASDVQPDRGPGNSIVKPG